MLLPEIITLKFFFNIPITIKVSFWRRKMCVELLENTEINCEVKNLLENIDEVNSSIDIFSFILEKQFFTKG